MTFVQRYTQRLDEYLKRENDAISATLGRVEALTGVPRLHQAIALLSAFVAYMIFGHFAQLICNAIGFAYPAYASLVALDSPIATQNSQISNLLRYWVVYAFVSVGDFFSGRLFRYIPFYWLAKMAFLVWCLVPVENNGTTVVYEKVIRPVFVTVQPIIDNYLNQFASFFTPKQKQSNKGGAKSK